MRADHKSVRFQLSRQYHFTLLGSACVKAAQKMLIKLTPDMREPVQNKVFMFDCNRSLKTLILPLIHLSTLGFGHLKDLFI